MISLTLYVFSPPMLAHGFLATADFALTFFMLAAVGAVLALMHRVSLGGLAACSFAIAGSLMTKYSAATLVPVLFLLFIIRLLNPAPLVVSLPQPRKINGLLPKMAVLTGAVMASALGVWLLIWCSYGFRFAMFNPAVSQQREPRPLFQEPGGLNAIGRFAEQEHLLPQAFLFGYSYMLERTQGGNAFLNGEFSTRGWLGFFPYSMAVKTPLELFLVLARLPALLGGFSVGAAIRPLSNNPLGSDSATSKLYEVAPLLVFMFVYWTFALTSHVNIGHRHVLPTYPPLFILAGAATWWFKFPAAAFVRHSSSAVPKWLSALRGVVVAALLLSAFEALWFWPHYLAYFNLLVGGPRYGYKHLVDSSLDWSQDVKELKHWFDAHPADVLPPQRVYLSFFGDTPMDYYGIQAVKLPSFTSPWQPNVDESLHGGTYCIAHGTAKCVTGALRGPLE